MNRGQVIIALLLVANLAATVWFGLNHHSHRALSDSPIKKDQLIEPAERQRLFDQFQSAFNKHDYDTIYGMLGPLAKRKVDKATIKTEFEKLIRYFKRIESGTYTHSDRIESQDEFQAVTLNYRVRLSEKSEFGQKGSLKISLIIRNDHTEVYGIRLTSG